MYIAEHDLDHSTVPIRCIIVIGLFVKQYMSRLKLRYSTISPQLPPIRNASCLTLLALPITTCRLPPYLYYNHNVALVKSSINHPSSIKSYSYLA